MRPERAGEAEEGIFPDGDAQAGAQEGGARQGTGGGWQTPVFLAAVGASGEAVCRERPPARLRGLRKTGEITEYEFEERLSALKEELAEVSKELWHR